MSSEQQTVSTDETWTAAPHERVLAGRGAEYGRTRKARQPPADAGCCRQCETPVEEVIGENTHLVLRVLADEHGRIPACTRCTDMSSITKAATQVQTSEQAREVSPIEAAEREWGER